MSAPYGKYFNREPPNRDRSVAQRTFGKAVINCGLLRDGTKWGELKNNTLTGSLRFQVSFLEQDDYELASAEIELAFLPDDHQTPRSGPIVTEHMYPGHILSPNGKWCFKGTRLEVESEYRMIAWRWRDVMPIGPFHVAVVIQHSKCAYQTRVNIDAKLRRGWRRYLYRRRQPVFTLLEAPSPSHDFLLDLNSLRLEMERLNKSTGLDITTGHAGRPSNLNPSIANDQPGADLDPNYEQKNQWIQNPEQSDSSELEGELYTSSDAKFDGTSASSPTNAGTIDELLQALEYTWYRKIQWSPEDDIRKGAEWPGPVKIAILDTGIDLAHDDFQFPARRRSRSGKLATSKLPEKPQKERIKACKNFVGGPGEDEDVSDSVGHGTHIAGIILSIAPRAELYIAKISSGENLVNSTKGDLVSGQTQRTTRRPIQEALQWAIDHGVHIINLSLGFPGKSSCELAEKLEEVSNKCVVFAAAANHGNRNAIAWPARDRDLAICVTSGDGLNNLSKFAPSGNMNLPVFVIHGEGVYSQWPTSLGGGYRSMTGTSVSTPIAVGMAAIILAFLNTTRYWSLEQKRGYLDQSTERKLRRTRGMGQLLEHICRDRNGLKVLSPKLMWEEKPDAGPFQVLAMISQAFRTPG